VVVAAVPWARHAAGHTRFFDEQVAWLAVARHRPAIDAALEHGLSSALIESASTKIRVITRVAFGFNDPAALIALAMLSLGGYRPPFPGI
jgi:hypothetical protein